MEKYSTVIVQNSVDLGDVAMAVALKRTITCHVNTKAGDATRMLHFNPTDLRMEDGGGLRWLVRTTNDRELFIQLAFDGMLHTITVTAG